MSWKQFGEVSVMRKHWSNPVVMRKMLNLVTPLSGWMCIAVLLGILGFLCAIFIPVGAVLLVLGNMDPSLGLSNGMIIALLIAASILRGMLRYGEQACNHYIAFKLLALLRDRIFGKLRTLAPARLEGQDKGNLISMITSDIELLEVFYAHTISPIIIAFLTSLILLVGFWLIDPIFALIALLGYLYVGLWIPIRISKLGKADGDEYRRQSGDLSAYMLESLRGIDDIRQFGQGDERLSQMNHRSNKLNALGRRLKRYEGKSASRNTMAILFFPLLLLFCGLGLHQHGMLSMERIILGTVLLFSSFGPVVALSNLSNNLLLTLASGRRVLTLLEEAPEVAELDHQKPIEMGDVAVEDVRFAYSDKWVLKDFDLELKKGSMLGIHGPSGCGKSTLLKLLMRFWSVEKGSIRIHDRDLRTINTSDLRDLESYMTQDTVLFQDTIENNIRIADLNATHEQVVEACRKASVHEFIMSLPEGYQTKVAELGESLSGGERQRIGLARVFLHDSELILLDEPTSNLDALHEGTILKSLKALKGKTVVLVSHRRSTLQSADTIINMDQGRRS